MILNMASAGPGLPTWKDNHEHWPQLSSPQRHRLRVRDVRGLPHPPHHARQVDSLTGFDCLLVARSFLSLQPSLILIIFRKLCICIKMLNLIFSCRRRRHREKTVRQVSKRTGQEYSGVAYLSWYSVLHCKKIGKIPGFVLTKPSWDGEWV